MGALQPMGLFERVGHTNQRVLAFTVPHGQSLTLQTTEGEITLSYPDVAVQPLNRPGELWPMPRFKFNRNYAQSVEVAG